MIPFEAAGAPVEQGRAQGESLGAQIRARMDRRRSWLARRALERRVRKTSARALETQLPWQRERIEGLAQAARVSEGRLLLEEAVTRVQGAAFGGAALLSAAFALPRELVQSLALRRSLPDAGGFASVELVLAPFAGCLCGVNSEGIAAICVRDLARDEPSLRFHAQELLFRARDLDAGIDHLRRRASYAGGTGALVVADAHGRVETLALAHGVLTLVPNGGVLPSSAARPAVALEPAARRLTFFGADGAQELARLDANAR